ncbi:hypothetical protein BDV59DRAFT_192817 [Aspergillus ambiguus]|uniref:uncharacterized protein n=1 Tax=Aspergillus ambiguus TaxID=176160 RepID=UPI003CCD71F5
MVFDALCEPLWMRRHRFEGDTLLLVVLKPVTKILLDGLRYLYTDAASFTQPDNMLLALRTPSVPHAVAEDEIYSPSPHEHLEGRAIYLSRNCWNLRPQDLGRAAVTDFGLAMHVYRTPEVCLGAGWDSSVDVWNLGVLASFDGPASDPSEYTPEAHLARIISLLGPAPADLLQRGRQTARYFDDQGLFRFRNLVGETGLAFMVSGIDEEDMLLFVRFVSRMLRWKPEDRAGR